MGSLGQGPVDETLAKLLDEPLLKSLDIDSESLESLSAEPKLAGTVAALFNLYKNTRHQLEKVSAQMSSPAQTSEGALDYSPVDEVSDFLQAKKNWFPELEEEAAALVRDFRLERQVTSSQLASALTERFVEEHRGGGRHIE